MMKKPHKLPDILTHDEIHQILDHTLSLKHKAMFMLAYSAGLRISEIAHLKTTDIDSTDMRILTRDGIGRNYKRCFHAYTAPLFATDLLNQGASLMEIKELLGHASLQSTTIYLHLANITDHMTSPLDILYGDEYV